MPLSFAVAGINCQKPFAPADDVAFIRALSATAKYLKSSGWSVNELDLSNNWMFWIDPLTQLTYRSDHAFTIQSDRDIWEKLLRGEWLKQRNKE